MQFMCLPIFKFTKKYLGAQTAELRNTCFLLQWFLSVLHKRHTLGWSCNCFIAASGRMATKKKVITFQGSNSLPKTLLYDWIQVSAHCSVMCGLGTSIHFQLIRIQNSYHYQQQHESTFLATTPPSRPVPDPNGISGIHWSLQSLAIWLTCSLFSGHTTRSAGWQVWWDSSFPCCSLTTKADDTFFSPTISWNSLLSSSLISQ